MHVQWKMAEYQNFSSCPLTVVGHASHNSSLQFCQELDSLQLLDCLLVVTSAGQVAGMCTCLGAGRLDCHFRVLVGKIALCRV